MTGISEIWRHEDTKSMVSKLLVALQNSLSHTWQWKKVQNALFQVSYFMLYQMVFPKILCNRPANQYHRQISLQGFFHATKKPYFYQLTRVFKANSIWRLIMNNASMKLQSGMGVMGWLTRPYLIPYSYTNSYTSCTRPTSRINALDRLDILA